MNFALLGDEYDDQSLRPRVGAHQQKARGGTAGLCYSLAR